MISEPSKRNRNKNLVREKKNTGTLRSFEAKRDLEDKRIQDRQTRLFGVGVKEEAKLD